MFLWNYVIPALHAVGFRNTALKMVDKHYPEYHGYQVADY
jgi:hypothetical protein